MITPKKKPSRKGQLGAPELYPWASWLKYNNIFTIRKSVDFQCLTRSMLTTLYQTAKVRGWRISVKEIDNDVLVINVLGRRKSA